jgi:NifU-like protein involved in Fe-S cluster formation
MDIKGLFEIHITVNHKQGFIDLYNYVNTSKDKLKLVLACMDKSEQYMLTKWCANKTVNEAIDIANNLADNMKSKGLTVSRVKVESVISNEGVPQTSEDYRLAIEQLSKHSTNKDIYSEFHYKILNNIEWKDLTTLAQKHGAAISVNLCGKEKKVLLTLRCYDGIVEACKVRDFLFKNLQIEGIHLSGEGQSEFSVYDTYPELDKDWLY